MEHTVTAFLTKAFLNNAWLFSHILLGELGGLVTSRYTRLNMGASVGLVLFIAILWEIYEYIVTDVVSVYGSMFLYFGDTFGDIAGAVIAAFLVCLFYCKESRNG